LFCWSQVSCTNLGELLHILSILNNFVLFCWCQVSCTNLGELLQILSILNNFVVVKPCEPWLVMKLKASFAEFWANLGLNVIAIKYHCRILMISSTKYFQILLTLICTFSWSIDLFMHRLSIHRCLSIHWSLIVIIVILQFCKKICDNTKNDRDVIKWILIIGIGINP
jgi:hypothetical protein